MHSGKVYFLDLQTLLSYLHGQSCTLSTEMRVNRKNAEGYIYVQAGEITGCLIRFANGQQLQGQAAYEQLQGCNQWKVHLNAPIDPQKASFQAQPGPLSPVQSASTNEPASSIPLKLKRPFYPAMLQNLPAKERLIVQTMLTLIDGRHTSEEIKARLHLTSEEIDTALRQLRSFNLIE